MRSTPVIDAHHHLWRYNSEEFDWIGGHMAELRRDFSAADLESATDSAVVDFTVAVQARQSLQETEVLLATAHASPRIAGVVGWLPLADSEALAAALHRFGGNSLLVGVRHVVQGEREGFLEDTSFNAGVALLHSFGLTYDLLLRADQLREAASFVDLHPRQAFVLDHVAKPRIAAGEIEPWARDLRDLSRRENVLCKLSGMVTEDDWHTWTPESLRPYLDVAVEAFGPSRLMAGSDWPVCLVATTYAQWWQVLRDYFEHFSEEERAAILGGNAIGFYNLNVAAA